MTDTKWVCAPGFPSYEVSDSGLVRRCKSAPREPVTGLPLKPWAATGGYLMVGLWVDGKKKRVKLHRLVCEAFHGAPPSPLHHAMHSDGIRIHNAASNLSWGTAKENQADRHRHGTAWFGSKHGGSRLTEDAVAAIRARYPTMGMGRGSALAKEFGVSQATISRVMSRTNWRHIT